MATTVRTRNLDGRARARRGMTVLTFTFAEGPLAQDQTVFVADQDYQFIVAKESHVASNASTTLDITKCTGTQAPSAGVSMLASTFNMAVGNNVVHTGQPTATVANRRVSAGDRICLNFTGTFTAAMGAALSLVLLPDPDKEHWIATPLGSRSLGQKVGATKGIVLLNFTIPRAEALIDQNIFVADQAYRVLQMQEVHAAQNTDTVMLKKCTGTQTPSQGADVLSAALSMNTDIQTVQTASLTTTEANLALADGDRLALDVTGTNVTDPGSAITILLMPDPERLYWFSGV